MIITGIILSVMLLSTIDYYILGSEVESLSGENYHNLNSERRTIKIVSLAVNVRSFINVANNLEFDWYEVPDLARLMDRFEYLGRFIQD